MHSSTLKIVGLAGALVLVAGAAVADRRAGVERTAAAARAASADRAADVLHYPEDGTCNVGAAGVNMATGDFQFVLLPGRGMSVVTNEDADRGVYHCQGDVPWGEVVTADEFFTGDPVDVFLITFEQSCDLFPGTCSGGRQVVDFASTGGLTCNANGIVTMDWFQRITRDGNAMIVCHFGR